MKDSQKEFFAARVDPEVLEILKAEAEARGVKVSAIAREAFAEWIAHHVENRCPWCGAVNLPGADWCGSCTAPLTATARKKLGDDTDRILDNITARSLTELERNLNEVFSQAQSKILEALEKMEDGEVSVRVRARGRGPGQEPITPEEST